MCNSLQDPDLLLSCGILAWKTKTYSTKTTADLSVSESVTSECTWGRGVLGSGWVNPLTAFPLDFLLSMALIQAWLHPPTFLILSIRARETRKWLLLLCPETIAASLLLSLSLSLHHLLFSLPLSLCLCHYYWLFFCLSLCLHFCFFLLLCVSFYSERSIRFARQAVACTSLYGKKT